MKQKMLLILISLIIMTLTGCSGGSGINDRAVKLIKEEKYKDAMNVLNKKVEKYIELSKDPNVYNYKIDLSDDLKQKIDLYNYASSLNSKEKKDYTAALDSLEYLDPIPNLLTQAALDNYKQELYKLNPNEDSAEKQKRAEEEAKARKERELAEEHEKKQKAEEEAKLAAESPPAIGMTKDEVLKSSWGKPKHINKTTTANYVSEQWVYSSSRYLYFENGILTTIQN